MRTQRRLCARLAAEEGVTETAGAPTHCDANSCDATEMLKPGSQDTTTCLQLMIPLQAWIARSGKFHGSLLRSMPCFALGDLQRCPMTVAGISNLRLASIHVSIANKQAM